MISKTRLFILALIILLVASLSLTVGVSYLLRKERATNLSLQNELEEIKTRQRITEARLEESKKLVAKFEINLEDAKKQIAELSSDLESEKALKEAMLTQVEQLRLDLDQQKSLRSDLEDRLSQAQEEAKKTDDRLWQLQTQRTALEVRIKSLEAKTQPAVSENKGVELGKIVVGADASAAELDKRPAIEKKQAKKKVKKEKPAKQKPEAKKQAPAALKVKSPGGLTGKVLVVNKDYDFLVIGLGSKEGVGTGDIFSVFQGDKYLGDVKVEKIHDSMSAAGFVAPDIKEKVREGDKVVKKTAE